MDINYYFLLYFLAGVLQDFLLTSNWMAVAKEKTSLASLYAFLTTVISLLVLYNILTKLDSQRSLVAILVYSLGVGVGTFLAMTLKVGTRNSK